MLIRLLRDRSGSSMIEFAILLPTMLLIYLGGYELSDMIACNRKVGIAARSLTDLASRTLSPSAIAASPSAASGTPFMSAAAITLTPYNQANAWEQISLLRVCDASHAYVIWSNAQNQTANGTVTAATPTLTAGTLSANSVISIPSTMITTPMVPTSPDGSDVCANYSPSTSTKYQVGTTGGYLFAGQISYSYTSLLQWFITTTIPMGYTIYMSPRLN
jgi:Flp pilus assembly protein TadG